MGVIGGTKVWVSDKGGVMHIIAVYGRVNAKTLIEVDELLGDGKWIQELPVGVDAIRCDLNYNGFWSLVPDGKTAPPFPIEGNIESLNKKIKEQGRIIEYYANKFITIRELVAPK